MAFNFDFGNFDFAPQQQRKGSPFADLDFGASRFSMPSAQEYQQPEQERPNLFSMFDMEPSQSMRDYREHLSALPERENLQPGIWERIAAGLGGASTAYFQGPQAGIKATTGAMRRKYDDALENWSTKAKGLSAIADMDEADRRNRSGLIKAYGDFSNEQLKAQSDAQLKNAQAQKETALAKAHEAGAPYVKVVQDNGKAYFFNALDGSYTEITTGPGFDEKFSKEQGGRREIEALRGSNQLANTAASGKNQLAVANAYGANQKELAGINFQNTLGTEFAKKLFGNTSYQPRPVAPISATQQSAGVQNRVNETLNSNPTFLNQLMEYGIIEIDPTSGKKVFHPELATDINDPALREDYDDWVNYLYGKR